MKPSIALGLVAFAFAAGAAVGWAPQDKAPDKKAPADKQAPTDKQPAKAADAMDDEMKAYMAFMTPGPEHARLAKKVGTWDLTVKFWMEPGAEPGVSENVSTWKMDLGGRFLVQTVEGVKAEEGWGKFAGTGFTGFNNGTKQYQSTWIDTMSTGFMNGTGTTNAKGDIEWTTEAYEPTVKKVVKSRGFERLMPDGSIVHEMFMAGPDGKEFKQMELIYRRKK